MRSAFHRARANKSGMKVGVKSRHLQFRQSPLTSEGD